MLGHIQNETQPAKKSRVWLRQNLRSQRGVSLMELMATVAVLSIVALGSTFLFSDLAKVQKRSSVANSIATMRGQLIAAITQTQVDPLAVTAWNVSRDDNTAATGNPLMACLRNDTPCTKDVTHLLNLKNFDGTEAYYSRTLTRGFDLDGRLCNTFDDVNGNPACPFRWVIVWIPRCVGADKTECDNPTIEVNGTLRYAPGNNDILGGTPFNPNVYDFSVRRGEKRNLNEPVVISYVENDATGETGSCFGVWHPREINTVVRDPGNNVTLVGTNRFSLRAGAYECRIQVPGFKNGGNQVRLVRFLGAFSAVQATSGTVTASMTGESATVMFPVTFSSLDAAQYRIEHLCSSQPDNQLPNPTGNQFILGVPVGVAGNYTGMTYTTINCVKTSGL